MRNRHEKPGGVTQKDWDDAAIPEGTEASFATAKPFQDVFPDQFASWKLGRGRPKSATPKVHIGFRLAPDVVEGIKSGGQGYNARVEIVLRDALAKGLL